VTCDGEGEEPTATQLRPAPGGLAEDRDNDASTRVHRGVRQLEPAQLESHRVRLFRAAYALSRSREDAEDLVQETYEQVLRRPRFLRHEDDLVYLLRVLRNRWAAVAQTAARRRTTPAAPEDLEWVVDRRAEPDGSSMDAKLAYAAIAELADPLRDTIIAVDVVGLSYREAARLLRTRTGTVMSRLFRARQRVAAALETS
jgi:RNA polymerase sigma-70 factor (ECF subfamily)